MDEAGPASFSLPFHFPSFPLVFTRAPDGLLRPSEMATPVKVPALDRLFLAEKEEVVTVACMASKKHHMGGQVHGQRGAGTTHVAIGLVPCVCLW